MQTPTLYRGQLIIPEDPRLNALMPHVKTVTHDGKIYAVVPHKLDEYKVLRNLGYDIAPPILTDYEWPIVNGYAPFDAQRYTAALISTNERCYVLNDLGTGKTRAALFAYDYMHRTGFVKSLLVIAPLSTLRRTWVNEVMAAFKGMTYQVLHGSAAVRRKRLAEPAQVYIVNHDGLGILIDDLIARPDIDMVIYDELTAIKTKNTARWKDANKLFQHKARVVGMTGLATPQAPTDAYGQIKALTPAKLNGWSLASFRDHTMRKVTQFKYLPRADASERVFAFMQPSIRFTRDQCIDLPPVQYVDYDCALSDEQRKLFNELKREFAAQLSTGEISTQNEADRINKMLQVILGCVYRTDGGVEYLDVSPRFKVLDDIIAASQGKVIVYTPYKHNLKMLVDHLQKTTTVAAVSGDTAIGERDRIFSRFQTTPDPHVLAAHPQCMSHGLTLTEASTIVWWGLPPSTEIYEQANARITRAGQRRSQYIARIVATSLETGRYRQLEKRGEMSGLLLDLVKSQQLSEIL